MIMQRVRRKVEFLCKLFRTLCSLFGEKIENPKPGFVPDRSLHIQIRFEREQTLLRQEAGQIISISGRTIGFDNTC